MLKTIFIFLMFTFFQNLFSKELPEENLEKRLIVINQEIDDEYAKKIIANLLYLDSLNNKPISLYINSPGGRVTSSLSIVDTINYIQSSINGVVVGKADSMAAIIYLSCESKTRKLTKNSTISFSLPYSMNVPAKEKDQLLVNKESEKLTEELYLITSKNSKLSINEVKEAFKNNKVFKRENAIKYGMSN